MSEQVIETLVISADRVPLPFVTEQVWPDGALLMLTAQTLPLAMASVKVTAPLLAPPSLKKAPSLEISQVTEPEAPETLPLILKVVGEVTTSEQAISTLLISAVRVPLPLVTSQF